MDWIYLKNVTRSRQNILPKNKQIVIFKRVWKSTLWGDIITYFITDFIDKGGNNYKFNQQGGYRNDLYDKRYDTKYYWKPIEEK